jgi:hypothetical protein
MNQKNPPNSRYKQGSGAKSWPLGLAIFGLLIAGSLYIGNIILRENGWLYDENLTPEKSREIITVSIKDSRFSMARAYLQNSTIKDDETVDSLVLLMYWPDMAPVPPSVLDASVNPNVITLTIRAIDMPMDSSDRLEAIYRRFFQSPAILGPSGLEGRTLDPESGYGEETIYYDPQALKPFTTRCTKTTEVIPGVCIRDINLPNGLSITYRFRPVLLQSWRSLDDAILTKLIQLTS